MLVHMYTYLVGGFCFELVLMYQFAFVCFLGCFRSFPVERTVVSIMLYCCYSVVVASLLLMRTDENANKRKLV